MNKFIIKTNRNILQEIDINGITHSHFREQLKLHRSPTLAVLIQKSKPRSGAFLEVGLPKSRLTSMNQTHGNAWK